MSVSLRQIAETAAFASARSMLLIESSTPVSDEQLHNYWKCCRGGLIDWLRDIDDLSSQAADRADGHHLVLWQSAVPILNEIFVSEILTRVWAATLTAMDMTRGSKQASPIARHTLSGHNEARNRALTLMVKGMDVPLGSLSQVDRLRRKAERWSDLLCGHLILNFQLEEFAFEPDRAVEFGQSQMREILRASDEPVWEFVLMGIRLAFKKMPDETPPSDAWNRGIIRNVLGSFPSDCFDDFGQFKGLRRSRVERSSERSDRFADALLQTAQQNPTERKASRLSFSALNLRSKEQ